MSGLELRLFGPPHVLRDDRALHFDTRKATAMLAVLAVEGGEQAREPLAAMLWPELDRHRSRAALRRTLSVAAAVVPELAADGQTVRLDLDRLDCDVVAFRSLVASERPADWQAAARLVRGPFMAGFSLRDSTAFDDWQFGLAASLRDDASLVFALLVDDAVRRGDLPGALGLAKRRIDVDSLSEPAYADLIRIAAWSGDRPAALQAYRDLVAVLERELGVAPLPATTALDRAIRDGTLAPPRGAVTRAGVAAVPAGVPQSAAMGDVVRQVVEAVFVTGPADRDLIRAVAGRSEGETAAGITQALAADLIRPSLDHELLEAADAVVLDLHRAPPPLPRLRLLHARAAEALARSPLATSSSRLAEHVGRHFAAAGRDEAAAGWFVTAARAAGEEAEHERALAALRSAVALGRNTLRVQIAISQELTHLGRAVEALVVLGRAAESAAGDPEALDAARDALAIAIAQQDRHGVVALRSHLADLLHSAGRDDEALAEQRRWATAFAELYGRAAPAPWALT